jgi:hypothetical protein
MIAIPSVAMDVYSDFFSRHELTHFCQISLLKPVMPCPYQDPLSVVLERAYKLGNFNASLFATEGIASAGLFFAPLTALLRGLVVTIGNRLSAGLPPRFILISGAMIPQMLLNVPLTTALLTHGAGILFLLWYITPRTMFEADHQKRPSASNRPAHIETGSQTTTLPNPSLGHDHARMSGACSAPRISDCCAALGDASVATNVRLRHCFWAHALRPR